MFISDTSDMLLAGERRQAVVQWGTVPAMLFQVPYFFAAVPVLLTCQPSMGVSKNQGLLIWTQNGRSSYKDPKLGPSI